jgi:gamma-glutamylcyclotransferase (GGCT)/AIG2-like uncharacterized protein YtfP
MESRIQVYLPVDKVMNLFAYGTLMDPDIMSHVSGQNYHPTEATLTGYRRRRIDGEMFPGITPDDSEVIPGILYRNITPTSAHRLDLFEGELYLRQTIQITLRDGLVLPAEGYIVKTEYRHRLSHENWTMQWFLLHGKTHFQRGYEGFKRV